MEVDTTPMQGIGQRVRAHARELGFDLFGATRVRPSDHAAFYRAWLAAGRHGGMSYLGRSDAVERRLHPEAGGARSAIVVGLNYYAGDETEADASRGVIARYARGRDYHKVIRKKLIELLRRLEADVGHALPLARACVDTAPVLERELARRAGLGWFGRSTMLLNPRRGSYFFLAALLVEIELDEYDAPFEADHCGTCNACVDACPTGALLGRDESGAPVMDATRCISYLTIEHRGAIPRELRPLMGNRVFGCDICQEVCPWNGPKFVQITSESDFARRDADARSLISLMSMTEAEWDLWTRGSPIRRAGYAGLKRNVAVALGNWASGDAVAVLSDALADANAQVRAHAAWALGEVGSAESRSALASRLTMEEDAFVRGELAAALAAWGERRESDHHGHEPEDRITDHREEM